MKIFITTMDEPYFMNPFIAKLLKERKKDIIGVASSKGGRLTTKKGRLDLSYAFTLFLIIGVKNSLKIGFTSILFLLQRKYPNYTLNKKPLSIIQTAKQMDIPTWEVSNVNDPEFIELLKKLQPDLIINQAQEIVKADFINIPSKGVLNRHSSLLPKNRGRLSPFWALYRQEGETGVTIHFVTEEIDKGDIICQEKIAIDEMDDFLSLTQKGYDVAANLMISAIKKVESGNYCVLPNNPTQGNYNTIPTLSVALAYNKNRLFRAVKRWI